MIIKKKDAVLMTQVLDILFKASKKNILLWDIIQNQNMLKATKEETDMFIKPNDKLSEFEQKRMDICKKHCDKNEDGTDKIISVMVNGNPTESFSGLDNNEEFKAEFAELKTEYEEVLKEREEQVKTFEDILNEEIDVNLKKLSVSMLPDEVLSGEIFQILSPILKD